MILARFKANADDYRPVVWPVKHPYWCTGYGDDYAIVVAYADDEAEIKRNWPESAEIEAEEVAYYVFTSRFPVPRWFNAPTPEVSRASRRRLERSVRPVTGEKMFTDKEIEALLAQTSTEGYPSDVRRLVHAVQAAERERCAVLVESRAGPMRTGAYEVLIAAAAAIRGS